MEGQGSRGLGSDGAKVPASSQHCPCLPASLVASPQLWALVSPVWFGAPGLLALLVSPQSPRSLSEVGGPG